MPDKSHDRQRYRGAGGCLGTTGTYGGHLARRVSSMRGTAVKGCKARPVGMKNRCPSKWSLCACVRALYSSDSR